MMAGLLFARAGARVLVLEKHGDFLRDFRGDTVHPSTMEILDQLGLLDRFLARPHDRFDQATVKVAGQVMTIGDLRHLKTPAPFIAMIPQWEFLNFLEEEASKYHGFSLRLNAEVVTCWEENDRITGVSLSDGSRLRAQKLVVAADGRGSVIRTQGLLPLTTLGAPIDVLWFSLPKLNREGDGIRGIFDAGRIMVMINRNDYWQCAFVIAKGGADAVRARGIESVRAEIEALVPEMGSLNDVLTDLDQLKLLSVALDRLDRWHRPGLLVIGDAAHAMSPIGGVGINLAIQDAVAAANILAGPLADGRYVDALLRRVEQRRLLPTRIVQRGQKFAQDNVIGKLLARRVALVRPPLIMRLINRFPLLRRIPGRMIGLGVRRERVLSPEIRPTERVLSPEIRPTLPFQD